ncbi:hypothetical protein LOTGIDRAFT_153369 [Lottia gigantea]|uniref:Uncharacterized protein n=1 Tax=Lottia gigantea TaxID=225164 RepID=V4AK27_LOTGI|nr:hypothetical protein LOTGIDRAFT_153369 [Lottia gigantea]ESO93896.1 hypothetical protein LOTGIDRAFT_153369 [Lottia gigantea]
MDSLSRGKQIFNLSLKNNLSDSKECAQLKNDVAEPEMDQNCLLELFPEVLNSAVQEHNNEPSRIIQNLYADMVAPTTPTRIFLGSPDDLLEVIIDTGTHRDYDYGVDDNEEFQNSNADDVNEDPDYEPDKDETTTDGRLDDRIKQPSTKKHKPNLESDHAIREPCKNCKRNCLDKIDEKRRKEIWEAYWKLNYNGRRQYLFNNVHRNEKRRQTTQAPSRRKLSYEYFLKDEHGTAQVVCKVFFLCTLGYHPKNDKMINTVMKLTRPSDISPPPDKRGMQEPPNKINREPIKAHIESFNPCISHYRRAHAPNRRYLPSDVSIRMMYDDFKSTAVQKCSYDTYRQLIQDMKISFTKLGEEECEVCLQHELHVKSDHADLTDGVTCDRCSTWKRHNEAAASARVHYQTDASNADANILIRSVDLQKVIMLPLMPGNKTAIFTKRIIAFNETFAAVGKQSKKPSHIRERSLAVLWHEGIGGRQGK